MPTRDWFRALQVPVLPVGLGPVVVGSLYGVIWQGGRVDVLVFALVALSIVLTQAGANLQKGMVESRDLPTAPLRPASAFVFDAGAVRRLGLDEGILSGLTVGMFAAGAGLGLLVVAIRQDPLLLALGLLGFVAAYSYSGPPFKFSYRGVGEVSTFFAFGPLMFSGAFYAQYPAFPWSLTLLGTTFGFLAAAISFARYFPAAKEDSLKGKRTPVVRLGTHRGLAIFVALSVSAALPLLVGTIYFLTSSQGLHTLQTMDLSGFWLLVPSLVFPVLILAAGAVAAMQLNSQEPRRIEKGVRTTVLLHYAVSVLWTAWLGFFLGTSWGSR